METVKYEDYKRIVHESNANLDLDEEEKEGPTQNSPKGN